MIHFHNHSDLSLHSHQSSSSISNVIAIKDRTSPPARIICALMMVVAIAVTPNAQWFTWLTYAVAIIITICMSRVKYSVLAKRIAIESIFVITALLGNLFHHGENDGGGIIWQWGIFQITATSLTILGSVLCKLYLSLLVMNLLTLTIPIPILLQSLRVLHVPPVLIAILDAMYRYLALLIEEFKVMQRAAIARNLMAGKRWQRLVVGNMIGSLFIRTYDRGNRIHQAMLSRGYQGMIHHQALIQLRRVDWIMISLTCLVVVLGQAIYLH